MKKNLKGENIEHDPFEELEADLVETVKDEELKYKTCLYDLYVKDFISFTHADTGNFTIIVEVRHNKLDFGFSARREATPRMLSIDGEHALIGACIMDMFNNILQTVEHGKANTIKLKDVVTTAIRLIDTIYQPEYDTEKKAWFILDKDTDERVY